MRAAVLEKPRNPLVIKEVAVPAVMPGHVLLRVRACGVCRTDLHIVEGELAPLRSPLIPGHQIVGEIVPDRTRVGVSWLGGVDGSCPYCTKGLENLCDAPTFTGYSVDGGYAEYALARADFVYPLPDALNDLHAAPLLCAGIIGFRSSGSVACRSGTGYGQSGPVRLAPSAHPQHRRAAFLEASRCVRVDKQGFATARWVESLGAKWVGAETDCPPKT